jgi:branched-chain amino acid transport system permease protein
VTGAAIGGIFVTLTVKLIEQVQGMDAVQELHKALPLLDLNALRMIIYSAVLIALMIWRPEGLLGERELFFKRSRK